MFVYPQIDKAVREVLQLDEIFNAKPAIIRAFTLAKDSVKSKRDDVGDDYIELKEFRFFLLALRQYFEYWQAFMRLDNDGDRRIDVDEFKGAQEMIEVCAMIWHKYVFTNEILIFKIKFSSNRTRLLLYSGRDVSFILKCPLYLPGFCAFFCGASEPSSVNPQSNKLHLNTASFNKDTLNNQYFSHKLTYFIVLWSICRL